VEEEGIPKIQIQVLHLHLVRERPVKAILVVLHITIQRVVVVVEREPLVVMQRINWEVLEEMV
jgi:hypothetical protein